MNISQTLDFIIPVPVSWLSSIIPITVIFLAILRYTEEKNKFSRFPWTESPYPFPKPFPLCCNYTSTCQIIKLYTIFINKWGYILYEDDSGMQFT